MSRSDPPQSCLTNNVGLTRDIDGQPKFQISIKKRNGASRIGPEGKKIDHHFVEFGKFQPAILVPEISEAIHSPGSASPCQCAAIIYVYDFPFAAVILPK